MAPTASRARGCIEIVDDVARIPCLPAARHVRCRASNTEKGRRPTSGGVRNEDELRIRGIERITMQPFDRHIVGRRRRRHNRPGPTSAHVCVARSIRTVHTNRDVPHEWRLNQTSLIGTHRADTNNELIPAFGRAGISHRPRAISFHLPVSRIPFESSNQPDAGRHGSPVDFLSSSRIEDPV